MKQSREDVIKYIDDFLEGKDGPHDWDDFISIKITNNRALDAVRIICGLMRDVYPPESGKPAYCSEEGMEIMRKLLTHLRGKGTNGDSLGKIGTA